MRPIRPAALLLVAAAAFLLAACSSEEPGWTYAPEPSATPVPSGAPSGEPSGAPGSPAPSGQASGAPTDGPGDGEVIQISAQAVQFDQDTLTVPADAPFQIEFANNDAGVQHNVALHEGSPTGPEAWRGDIFAGVETRVYEVPPLPAGEYGFICTVHPQMTGTATLR